MSIFIVGGAGFIGRRLIPKLVDSGERVVCMDINPGLASGWFDELGDKVQMVRGDVTQFDVVMAHMVDAQPKRVLNLSYHISSDLPPHAATKLNVVGMDNCFEAARLCKVPHTIYASSLAVSGPQKNFGERAITEDDDCHGFLQYAMNKRFNEFQARDYTEKYGMTITGVRPANVTGPDKVDGSIDHVNCIVQPARGKSVTFPYKDTMRIPVHVEDIAEVFARVTLAEKPRHSIYNSGGTTTSLGDLADLVRSFLPDADIRFEHETGGLQRSGNYMIDNARMVEEFGVQFAPFPRRVMEMINHVRREEGLELIASA
ncbi:MAG: nucleoside-diphosphate-sugar epimerase [Gammaproteobacteria bacterium]|jgi:nucleoside-diphosphate-sugar epimerase